MARSSLSTLFRSKSDFWLTLVTRTCAVMSATIVIMVAGFLFREASPAINEIGVTRFLTDESWHPLSEQFNLTPMIFASLLITGGSILLAAPLGIAGAVFCEFYAPQRIAVWYRRAIELLAGIPSVVFGLWGLVVLVPIVARLGGSGQCLFTATLILALMILPTVTLSTLAAFRAVPVAWITGGAALGFGTFSTVWRIVIPAARRGIAVGLVLAVTRAVGETMAVLMLAGNVVEMPSSLLDPARTLTANIALEMGYASRQHRSILFVSGLILISVVALSVTLSGFAGSEPDE